MNFIALGLAIILFITLILMVWLWQRLSKSSIKLHNEISDLRLWKERHLPQISWLNFMESSLRGINYGIILVNPSLDIIFMNHAAEAITGQRLENSSHRPYKELLKLRTEDGQEVADSSRPLLEAFEKRQTADRQRYIINADGHDMTIEISWVPILSDHQQIVGGAVVLRDISKQKALEEMKVDFVSIVSHELRTPITAIKGYIDILLREVRLDPEHAEMLRRVYVSNERQLETVESLLNLSRLERGTVPVHPQSFQIEELVGQVISEVDSQAKSKGLNLRYDYPRFALPKVWADPARTREVLINLCTNAIKYTDQGWVRINVESIGNELQVSVQDTGPGIPADVQEKLFAKFQRGEGVLTETKQGMGLGLYITREFVELMGGKIWLDSKEGKGATFYFTLPTQG